MGGADVFGLIVSVLVVLYLLYALVRGGEVLDVRGLCPDRDLHRCADRADAAARCVHGARVHARAHDGIGARARSVRALALSGVPGGSDGWAGLEALRAVGDRVLAGRVVGDVRDSAHADAASVLRLPGRPVPLGYLGRDVQHGVVVCLEHELAVLRRGDDAHLHQPDDGDDCPELRLRRRRDRGPDRADPRHHVSQRQEPWQLLAGHGAHAAVRAAAAVGDRRLDSGLAGRDPEPQPLHDRAHPGRRHPVDRAGACRLADRDQATGHQRRWVLQHQLRIPVRERDPVFKLRRDAVHRADPRRAHLHVRDDGRQSPPGMGDLCRDVRAVDRRGRRCLYRRAARHPGAAWCWRQHPRDRRLLRREHGGQGGAQRDRELCAVGHHHQRHLQRVGQRRDGVVHGPRAAPFR